jgi:hypothetical protein
VTSPAEPAAWLPAAQARQILDLPGITEAMLSALRARGKRGNPAMLASIEQLAALLTSGGDASGLISRLDAAQREPAALMPAREDA